MNYLKRHSASVFVLAIVALLTGCDGTIEPIADTGTAYSISGPLDIQNSPNYIRVHDVNALLNPEATRELDVQVLFTNLTTMESTLLQDNVVRFDNIYTHNFVVETPIDYDTRYRIDIEDARGFRDSLISKTTKESNMSVSTDSVECDERFFVELTNIDLGVGERLDAEVAVNANNTWHWTRRIDFQEYDSDTKIMVLGWSPYSISQLLWPPPFAQPIPCHLFTMDFVRFKFTHIGYVEGEEIVTDIDQDEFTITSVKQRRVLSKYSDEAQFTIVFED